MPDSAQVDATIPPSCGKSCTEAGDELGWAIEQVVRTDPHHGPVLVDDELDPPDVVSKLLPTPVMVTLVFSGHAVLRPAQIRHGDERSVGCRDRSVQHGLRQPRSDNELPEEGLWSRKRT